MNAANAKSALSRLRVRHLRLLELLAPGGTARKAAEQLHLSHPAVSQMIKEIEAVFGGPLFERTARGVVPNARLRSLMPRVRVILRELAAAEAELVHNGPGGQRVQLGTNLHLLTHLLPRAIGRLRAAHPELRLSLREGSVTRIMDGLLDGELDCAIGRVSPRYSNHPLGTELAFWPVYREEHCLVVGRHHPLARRQRLQLRDLLSEAWVLSYPGNQSREMLDQVFLQAGLQPPRPVVECRPFYASLSYVTEAPLVTMAMKPEALRGERAGLLRICPSI
jgi:DNA-binding transcriptional LysR family regulator